MKLRVHGLQEVRAESADGLENLKFLQEYSLTLGHLLLRDNMNSRKNTDFKTGGVCSQLRSAISELYNAEQVA